MKKELKPDTWVWVVVQNPGPHEQYLGQEYEEQRISFIPAFFEKEDAQQCLIHMTTARKDKHEIQAVMFKELTEDAAKHGFMVFMLGPDGKILEKIKP